MTITPLYLHVVRFLDEIGGRRRLEVLKIHKLKLRKKSSKEASPDQVVDVKGSEDDLNFQEEDEWLEDLEHVRWTARYSIRYKKGGGMVTALPNL
jgi:hypothetical protein